RAAVRIAIDPVERRADRGQRPRRRSERVLVRGELDRVRDPELAFELLDRLAGNVRRQLAQVPRHQSIDEIRGRACPSLLWRRVRRASACRVSRRVAEGSLVALPHAGCNGRLPRRTGPYAGRAAGYEPRILSHVQWGSIARIAEPMRGSATCPQKSTK